MSKLFIHIINMSISASWIVLAVVVLRLLMKKAPKWITVLLWGMVAIRLICPFTVESAFSLIPSRETVSPDIMMDRTPEIHSGIPLINNSLNPIITGSFSPAPMDSANPLQIWIPVAASFWLMGVGIMLLYLVGSYLRIRRKTANAVHLRGRIYQSEYALSPFVLGIGKPLIYLPVNLSEEDQLYVIAHEQAHIRRRDHWWKPLGFLLLAIHWFNPLMWLGYLLLCRDIEYACDEKVIQNMGREQKADYSQALLNCSAHPGGITACPLAFGEVSVKKRVKTVLSYRKPAFWILILGLLISSIAVVCLLTDPPEPHSDFPTGSTEPLIGSEGAQLTLEDVIALSEKGEALTWKDFEQYRHIDTGSGLYIRYYEIDALFSLSIGGDPASGPPMYIALQAHDVWEDQIDIRSGDVEAFIKAHKDHLPVRHISLGNHLSPVDFNGDGYVKMVQFGGIPADAHISNRQALATAVISSAEELEQFRQHMQNTMDFDLSYPDAVSFNQTASEYDANYFNHAAVILIYIHSPSPAHRFTLEYAAVLENTLSIGIQQILPEGSSDTVMHGWLMGVRVPKNELEQVDQINAQIVSEISESAQREQAEVTGLYVMADSQAVIKPSFTLYANGKFTFSFSALSSYFGIGDYILEKGRLLLLTEDGRYEYRFQEVDGNMVFDAEGSSDMLWFSDMKDGSVFTNRIK